MQGAQMKYANSIVTVTAVTLNEKQQLNKLVLLAVASPQDKVFHDAEHYCVTVRHIHAECHVEVLYTSCQHVVGQCEYLLSVRYQRQRQLVGCREQTAAAGA